MWEILCVKFLVAMTLTAATVVLTGVTAAAPHTLAAPQWGYEGSAGPDKWARLDVANEACEMGEIQSPFDIPFSNVCASILGAFDFAYNAMQLKVIGNDHIV